MPTPGPRFNLPGRSEGSAAAWEGIGCLSHGWAEVREAPRPSQVEAGRLAHPVGAMQAQPSLAAALAGSCRPRWGLRHAAVCSSCLAGKAAGDPASSPSPDPGPAPLCGCGAQESHPQKSQCLHHGVQLKRPWWPSLCPSWQWGPRRCEGGRPRGRRASQPSLPDTETRANSSRPARTGRVSIFTSTLPAALPVLGRGWCSSMGPRGSLRSGRRPATPLPRASRA